MSNRQPPSNDELEIAEAKNPLTDLLYDYTAQAMTTRVGSYVYHQFDACLAIVEKTAKWSLPQTPPASDEDDTTKMNISPPPLIRPLPWILFLPALIALRLLRVSLSFFALLIGKQPVYPVTMVSFLQSRRRKLRALKYRGQKLQRMKRAEMESEEKAEAQMAASWLQRITLPLRYIICLRAVRPGTSTIHQREHHHHHHHHHRQTGGQSRELTNDDAAAAKDDDGSSRAKPRDESAAGGCRKRNAHERDADDSESSFEEASVQELLDKYANAEGDSSYHASDSGSSESDSFVSESDKSLTETAAPTEQNDSKKVKKESNGHATPPEKEAASSQKPEESKKKSSLNAVDNNGKPDEKAKPTATAESATENGNAGPQKDQKAESQTEASQEPVKAAAPDTKGNSDSKPANLSNSAKDQPSSEGNKKSDNPTATKNQSPASTKEVKTNQQQRNKQQQQHQQQHHPNNQQQQQHPPQQQQHHQQQQHQQQQHQQHQHQQQQHQQQQHQQSTTANGGGGKKHKKPHHQNAQQHH